MGILRLFFPEKVPLNSVFQDDHILYYGGYFKFLFVEINEQHGPSWLLKE